MGKAEFTFQIDEDLKAAFSAAAEAEDRSVDELLRQAMQDYLLAQAEDYYSWFLRQVPEALDDPRPGILNKEVEAEFAAKCAATLARLCTQD